MTRRGCRTGDRAARDQQDSNRRGSGGDQHAGLSRRGAALDRVGVAVPAENAGSRSALTGTELRVEAGRLLSTNEVGAPEGTLIEVADLFFNLPARRKFLKADTAESAQVSRLVTQLALGYPEVGFVLKSGGRVLIEAPPAGSLAERFYQIYGDRPDLVPVAKDAAGISIHGFVAALGEQGPARGPQHIFVNRRIVRDRTIAHAIQQAYSVATIKERSPEVHLFMELAPDRVDVNVHPTKAEVRFLEQGLVHEVLRRAIVDALGATTAPELVLRGASVLEAVGLPGAAALPLGFGGPGARAASLAGVPASEPGTTWPSGLAPAGDPRARRIGAWPGPGAATAPGREAVGSLIRPMAPLGQFRNTFIIAVDDEGLAIIDQHVAHERILFEQISERLTGRALESQRLLSPVVLEVSAGEHQTLLSHAAALGRFGFEIEDFGGASLRVAAVPALLDWTRSEAALRAVAADLDGLSPGAGDRRRAPPPGRDDGVPCGGQGQRPAHAREDAVPARRTAADGAFVGVSAWTAGGVAIDPKRDRAELRKNLRKNEATEKSMERLHGEEGPKSKWTPRAACGAGPRRGGGARPASELA